MKVYITPSISAEVFGAFESGLVNKRANAKFHAKLAVAFVWEDWIPSSFISRNNKCESGI